MLRRSLCHALLGKRPERARFDGGTSTETGSQKRKHVADTEAAREAPTGPTAPELRFSTPCQSLMVAFCPGLGPWRMPLLPLKESHDDCQIVFTSTRVRLRRRTWTFYRGSQDLEALAALLCAERPSAPSHRRLSGHWLMHLPHLARSPVRR